MIEIDFLTKIVNFISVTVKMKLLPILLAFTEAKKKGAKETTECGCNVETVASSYINGSGTATCTAEGKKSGKGKGLLILCFFYFFSDCIIKYSSISLMIKYCIKP